MKKEFEDENFSERFLSVNIKTLKLVGLWNSFGLERKENHSYTAYTWFVFVLILGHVVSQIADLFYCWDDLENFCTTASTALTLGAASVKHLCYLMSKNRIYELIYRLKDGKLSSSTQWSKEQKMIAHNYDRHVRIMSWSYYCLGIGCLSSLVLTTVKNIIFDNQDGMNSTETSERKFPYRAVYPFDLEEDRNYATAFCFQMIVILLGPTVNIGMDAMFVGLALHACGELRILKLSLRTIKERSIENLIEEWNSARKSLHVIDFMDLKHQEKQLVSLDSLKVKMSTDLNHCVHHHQKIMKFIVELEDIFNPMMLAQFLSSSGTLCLIIFRISVAEDLGIGMAALIQFLAISIMQLLLFCWYGNELTYQCETIVRAAYESPWYEATESFKRSVRIMVVRAMKPFYLTGGKFYFMTLDTFVVMLKASFSYYTLLRNLNES